MIAGLGNASSMLSGVSLIFFHDNAEEYREYKYITEAYIGFIFVLINIPSIARS